MKLRAHDVAVCRRRRRRVIRTTDLVLRLARRERWDEVEVGVVGPSFPQRRRPRLRHTAPPDHRQPAGDGYLDDATRQKSEARVATVLCRLFEQELITEANAEDGLAEARQLDDPAAEARFNEPGERRRERADAWQHNPVSRGQIIRSRGQTDLGSDVYQRALGVADDDNDVVAECYNRVV